ncbi:MAG: ECF transporter S component [Promethearchaeota archaeon]
MVNSESTLKEVVTMREIAMAAAFISMVFLSTSLFYIALVSSTGFFNIGEAFIYLAALVGGPIVGALAGGVGAAMADMVLGYGIFAPGTLIFKGMEGFTVGFIYHRGKEIDQKVRYLVLSLISLFLVSFAVFVTTPWLQRALLNPLLSEDIEGSSIIQGAFIIFGFSLGDKQELVFELPGIFDFHFWLPFGVTQQELPYEIPGILILFVVLLLILIIWVVELKMGEKGRMVLSCLLAGPIIVVGYFLYEIFVLSVPFGGALSEVPFNIAQVVFGIVIAVPIYYNLRELGLKRGRIS